MKTATRSVLDVSELPGAVLDHRSPIWWGNLLLIMIETTMFGILVAAYFYLRMNFEQWPPPQSNSVPPDFTPLPSLGLPGLNLFLMLVSVVPMWWADRSALRRRRRGVDLGLIGSLLLMLAAIALRFYEFDAVKFRWDDNAYGSIVVFILGMHLAHLITGACESALMLAWVTIKGLDDKHARDVRVTAVYWYWVVGVWLPLFGIVFLGPYFIA
jgi:cytochrome c oxidase subunit III